MRQEERSGSREPEGNGERVPAMQEAFDNIWVLFLASGVIILVFYIIWALIDLIQVPVLP